MKGSVSFFVGFTFALGLGISGMTRPDIVQGFLDIFGNWDPRLMGVMVGAIGLHFVTFRLIVRRPAPVCGASFDLPEKKSLDRRLIVGAILFGVGWGWAGICPGPGIVGLASGKMPFLLFVGSMLVGMKGFQYFERRFIDGN